MSFYLGIDGGGSKTAFLLGDEENVLAAAETAGSNLLRCGEAATRAALHEGVDEICRAAGIQAAAIERVVAGIAGSSNDEVRTKLNSILREKTAGQIEILGDMVIAHYAALQGEPGLLVNAGTGSIAYGRNHENETARAGGWGFAVSDEGSGHWIGRAAVAVAMRSFDRGLDEGYIHHLAAALGGRNARDLVRFATANANPDFAQLFPAVQSIAELGDRTAQEILRRAGDELAALADVVFARVFPQPKGVTVVATGGVFRSSDAVFQSFKSRVEEQHPGAEVRLSESQPAMGALMLARTGVPA